MKILVTGGAGFVGSNLVNYMLNKGHEIVLYDDLSRKGTKKNLDWLKENHNTKLDVVLGDIRDYSKLKEVVRDVDVVYHTAAQVAVTTSVTNPILDFEINALGTLNVLEAARNTNTDPALIFTSTNKVYGKMDGVKVIERDGRYDYKTLKEGNPETQSLDFHSPYGCSKGAADQYVRDYSRIYGMKNVVFRMSCIYGTRQFGCVDQGWVSFFIISSILKEPLTIFGES